MNSQIEARIIARNQAMLMAATVVALEVDDGQVAVSLDVADDAFSYVNEWSAAAEEGDAQTLREGARSAADCMRRWGVWDEFQRELAALRYQTGQQVGPAGAPAGGAHVAEQPEPAKPEQERKKRKKMEKLTQEKRESAARRLSMDLISDDSSEESDRRSSGAPRVAGAGAAGLNSADSLAALNAISTQADEEQRLRDAERALFAPAWVNGVLNRLQRRHLFRLHGSDLIQKDRVPNEELVGYKRAFERNAAHHGRQHGLLHPTGAVDGDPLIRPKRVATLVMLEHGLQVHEALQQDLADDVELGPATKAVFQRVGHERVVDNVRQLVALGKGAVASFAPSVQVAVDEEIDKPFSDTARRAAARVGKDGQFPAHVAMAARAGMPRADQVALANGTAKGATTFLTRQAAEEEKAKKAAEAARVALHFQPSGAQPPFSGRRRARGRHDAINKPAKPTAKVPQQPGKKPSVGAKQSRTKKRWFKGPK